MLFCCSQLLICRPICVVGNLLLLSGWVNGTLHRRIGLSVDQLVVVGHRACFAVLAVHTCFFHLVQSCTAFFPSWEWMLSMAELCQSLTFSACLLQLETCNGDMWNTNMWSEFHNSSRWCIMWQDMGGLSYCTDPKHRLRGEGPEQCVGWFLYCCCMEQLEQTSLSWAMQQQGGI